LAKYAIITAETQNAFNIEGEHKTHLILKGES